jgi:hypothetical protein
MRGMARLRFGRLTEAWRGEAADFTPLLAEQMDAIGAAIGLDLTSIGESEVQTTGGRRIDIVARGEDGSEFVIENQYGRADHDHLTRGLAYAVARRARGLVVVAEEHRDEFRAVAQYLNELAELDSERGIAVWLVEAKAVRIEDSAWAPLFSPVVEPNAFTARVEEAKHSESTPLPSVDAFWEQFESPLVLDAAKRVVSKWLAAGYRKRLGPNHVVLEAPGPATSGIRTVVAIYSDGRVFVPFNSYAGQNSGIPVGLLVTERFRSSANSLFGFDGSERQARTAPGWLTPDRAEPLFEFCQQVTQAYAAALDESDVGD